MEIYVKLPKVLQEIVDRMLHEIQFANVITTMKLMGNCESCHQNFRTWCRNIVNDRSESYVMWMMTPDVFHSDRHLKLFESKGKVCRLLKPIIKDVEAARDFYIWDEYDDDDGYECKVRKCNRHIWSTMREHAHNYVYKELILPLV